MFAVHNTNNKPHTDTLAHTSLHVHIPFKHIEITQTI